MCDTRNAPLLPVKSTVGTPLKPVPVIVTFAPPTAAAGVKEVTCGRTTNVVELAPVPPAVVTVTVPVVAAFGTTTWSEVPSAATLLNAPAAPLNLTEVTPKKPVPVTVMLWPAKPDAALRPAIVGSRPKVCVLTTLPPTAWTVTLPVALPLGTVTVRCVGESTVTDGEGCPLKRTVGTEGYAAKKFVPVIATVLPPGPDPGEMLEIVGLPIW